MKVISTKVYEASKVNRHQKIGGKNLKKGDYILKRDGEEAIGVSAAEFEQDYQEVVEQTGEEAATTTAPVSDNKPAPTPTQVQNDESDEKEDDSTGASMTNVGGDAEQT